MSNLLSFFVMLLALLLQGCNETNTVSLYHPSVLPLHEQELIVGVHPYLNTQKTFNAYEPLLRYLETQLPKVHFRLETSLNYPDYERKLYAGHFDLAIPNPYQTLKSINHGYRIIAKVKPDSQFRGIIIARKDRHIRVVEQLRGQSISFPAPTALAATLMPKLFLFERGLNVDTQAHPHYVGSQYSSIMNAYRGDTVAAATWPSPWKTWRAENPQKAKEMELLWQTPPLVNIGVVVRCDFNPLLAHRITTVLSQLDHTSVGKNLIAPTGFEGFEPATLKMYRPVEAFIVRYERALGVPR
ncbi:MAG: phosphate/phosphite/phosphonate ABC transporter substrate-binding protein [Sulfuricurvum sp.]